ncbi:MAG TPA: hypothetical protein VGE05_01470 [Novosphingobium sp.]
MRGLLMMALVVLGGCSKPEPSFDERYSQAEKSIMATGAAIDSELKAREDWRMAEDAAAKSKAVPTQMPLRK